MIIELLNGQRIDIQELFNVRRLFHRIPSLSVNHDIQSVEGKGDIVVGSNYNSRTISVQFLYDVDDIYGYYLLRDELNAIFAREEAFYIIFKREQYKRYKVKLAQQINIEPSPKMNTFNVEFLLVDKFGESTGTSLDLQNRREWDVDLWGFGSGINYDEVYNYSFNSNSFVLKNIGNQTVDPRENNLEITIKGSFSSFIQIQNNTTGDIYRFNQPLLPTDTLVISGVRTLKNNISSFRNTNFKLLKLSPGDNSFTVTGGTLTSAIFNFRFIYK